MQKKRTFHHCARLKMYDYNNEVLYEFLPEFLGSEAFQDCELIDKELSKNFSNDELIVVSKEIATLPFIILNIKDAKEKKDFRATYEYDFEYILTEKCPIGVLFQEACLSPEWQASGIVYHKYKNKYNLGFNVYEILRNYITDWSIKRQIDGKKVNKDILIQECSAELKRNYIK